MRIKNDLSLITTMIVGVCFTVILVTLNWEHKSHKCVTVDSKLICVQEIR